MRPEFDPRAPGFLAGLHPLLHALRAEDPVHRSERLGAWVLTGYQDVKAALNDPRLSADRISPFRDSLEETERARVEELLRTLGDWMVFCDPPRHTRLRRVAKDVFPARVMEGMEPRVIAAVEHLLGRIAERGEADLIRDLGFPLPVLVIADMLGVPRRDQDKFKAWSDDLATFVGSAQLTPDKRSRAQESARELCAYFRDTVACRRAEPQADGISALIEAAAPGPDADGLSEEELVATCVLLLFAGHETTTNLIGNGMLSLMRQPGELARLRRAPALARSAVEELLRFEGPTLAMTRIVREPCRYGGRTLAPGDRVFALIAGANRDPAQFTAPDRIDIARQPNRHLAFGYGIHFCLGAPLARLEGRIAIAAVSERLEALTLETAGPEWIDSLSLRGVRALPVRFRPCGSD